MKMYYIISLCSILIILFFFSACKSKSKTEIFLDNFENCVVKWEKVADDAKIFNEVAKLNIEFTNYYKTNDIDNEMTPEQRNIFNALESREFAVKRKLYNLPRDSDPCSNSLSYKRGYQYAQDQIGQGLMADCDYLYKLASSYEQLDHTCFCQGVNDWISKHK
jgi:hypothetical protein